MKATEILKHFSIVTQSRRVFGIYRTVEKKFNIQDILHTSSAKYLYGHEEDIEIGCDIFCLCVEKTYIKEMHETERRGYMGMSKTALWQLTQYGRETLRYEVGDNVYYIYKLD